MRKKMYINVTKVDAGKDREEEEMRNAIGEIRRKKNKEKEKT